LISIGISAFSLIRDLAYITNRFLRCVSYF